MSYRGDLASLLAFMPMADSSEREAVAEFVHALYDLGGFTSWGEYARESGFLASTMSDWSRGKNAPSGPSLLRLIHAATDRAPLAMRKAAERTSPATQTRAHLESLEEKADEALTGIANILDLLRGAPGQSGAGAQEGSPP